MSIQLQLGSSIVSTFPRLNYRWWYAIAELIDNSTQSYFDNKEALDKHYKKTNDSLKISFVKDKNFIRLSDNAFGMNENILERALTVVASFACWEKETCRSRYGMGMKTSSGWMGETLSIRTTELNSGKEISLKVHWPDVAAGNTALEIKSRKVPKTSCGTTIEVSNLHNPMQVQR